MSLSVEFWSEESDRLSKDEGATDPEEAEEEGYTRTTAKDEVTTSPTVTIWLMEKVSICLWVTSCR